MFYLQNKQVADSEHYVKSYLWAGRMMGSLPSVPFVSHSGVQARGPEPRAETTAQQISVCGEGLYVLGLLTAS